MKRLIASTEDLNRNCYRVMTDGIKLENFVNNPVLLLFHNGRSFPIGRATDLKKETIDGKYVLTFLPEFAIDVEGNVDAKLASDMYEKGWLKSCSIGHDPITLSADPELLLPGQLLATVLETELLEISFAPIPGNAFALTLGIEPHCELSKITKLEIQNKPTIMKLVLSQLGLVETATEAEVLAAVTGLQNQIAVRDVNTTLELGRTKGIVTDANIESYRTLGMKDIATLNAIFSTAVAPVTVPAVTDAAEKGTMLSAVVKPAGTTPQVAADEVTFAKLEKSNPKELLRIKTDEPELYKKLYTAYIAEA